MDLSPELSLPERSLRVRRAAARLCVQMGWSPVHEVPLPNHRRADILALRGDGGFVCIEVKSGVRDFQTDSKWPEYREFSDALYFAVDGDFPLALLPEDTGLIVACGPEAEIVREAPPHPLAPARRRALLHRFATLAAQRLAWLEDPEAMSSLRAALRSE
jgi:hypothetical protein